MSDPVTYITYRYAPGDQPFGPYKIESQVRRSDIYEQYNVRLESGARLGLKSVSPQLAPRLDGLVAAAEPFSVGLLSVIDFGQPRPGGDVLVVTELAGTTLRERLRSGEPIPPDQALAFLSDISRALATLEARSLPMPTVSPEAVCLRQDGVRLDDHYLPLLFDGQRLPPNFMLAAYAAPELDQSGPGSKATLFSVGVVFYEMVTGRHPFEGSVFEVIAAIRTREADLQRVPEQARQLLSRLLTRNPAERFSSLAELASAFEAGTIAIDASEWIAPPTEKGPPARQGPSLEPIDPNEGGRRRFRRTIDGAVMVLVPGGEFTMGNADGSDAEKPPVRVALDPFLIDEHPVTWEMFVAVHKGHDKSCDFCAVKNQVLPSRYMPTPMNSRDEGSRSDIERRLTGLNDAISSQGGEHIPVSYLTWKDMRRYADMVGAELPSEAEWEYANRAGTTSLYPWGNDIEPACAWFMANSGGVPHPVAKKRPNAWGLHDMNGNVLEMCRDRFVKDIYDMIAGGAAAVQELVDGVDRPGTRYSARGGAFSSSADGVTCSFRIGAAPDIRSDVRGFRCVIRRSKAPEWAVAAFATES